MVLGWARRLETHPWEPGGELGSPPGSAPCPALQAAARVPFLLLLLIEGEGNGVNLAWEEGAPSVQILPFGADLWSLNTRVATVVRAFSG